MKNWEKKLQVCILDYLIRNGMTEIALMFANQTGLTRDDIATIPANFLLDWWIHSFDQYVSNRLTNPTSIQNSVTERPMSISGSRGHESFRAPVTFKAPNSLNLYPSNNSSSGKQFSPLPQQHLVSNQNIDVGAFGMSSSYGDRLSNSLTLMSGFPLNDQSLSNTLKMLDSIVPTAGLTSFDDGVKSSSISKKESYLIGGMSESTAYINNSAKNGSSLVEINNLTFPGGQLICCDFSSEGDILACIGQDKTVVLMNTNCYTYVSTPKAQFNPIIMDARFAPGSSYIAAYYLDKTIKLWNANKASKPLANISFKEPVISMDFNPRNIEQLYFCDSSEIRLWNVKKPTSERFVKAITRQIRFNPGDGKMLAALTHNQIRLFDVETKSLLFCITTGHKKNVQTICWDVSGKYIASVSKDEARVWSLVSGPKPVHEIQSNGKIFQCCTSHPLYPQAFVIGANQSLEVWNPCVRKGTESVGAHSGKVYALCSSPKTGLIASTSDDKFLKIWK